MNSFNAERSTRDVQARSINEDGAALIMALLVLTCFGMLTAAIVFTVANETRVSANYKYGQQAFYVANAGVQKSLNWFNDAYASHVPSTDYDTAKAPVRYTNQDVILAGKPGYTSVYPESSASHSFSDALAVKTLVMDIKNSGQYAVNAILIRSKSVKFLDTTTFTISDGALERWRLDSTGYWGTIDNPTGISDLSAVIERSGKPFWGNALWVKTIANMNSSSFVDSYDSTIGPYGGSNVGNLGDVGSNDDLSLTAGATIHGHAIMPSTGTFTSWDTPPGSQSVTEGLQTLAQPKDFPAIPAFTVGTLGVDAPFTLPPGRYGKVTASSGKSLILTGGTYYIDNLSVTGNATLVLPTDVNVTLYVKSKLDFNGGSVINATQDPSQFQILYSGTTNPTFSGGNAFYGTVYIPNADLTLTGGAGFFGSFMANKISMTGGADVHYDTALLREFITPQPFKLITWTQKTS